MYWYGLAVVCSIRMCLDVTRFPCMICVFLCAYEVLVPTSGTDVFREVARKMVGEVEGGGGGMKTSIYYVARVASRGVRGMLIWLGFRQKDSCFLCTASLRLSPSSWSLVRGRFLSPFPLPQQQRSCSGWARGCSWKSFKRTDLRPIKSCILLISRARLHR